MRTLFSGEELNRFLDDTHDFKLPNGDLFEDEGYFAIKPFDKFSPLVVYDISKLENHDFGTGEDDEPPVRCRFDECFYAWCKQVGTDIYLTDNPYSSVVGYMSQPEPVKNDLPAVWDLVIEDMKNRDEVGAKKYGTHLQPHNGRDTLVDAYQEALDLSVYLRTLMYERNGK